MRAGLPQPPKYAVQRARGKSWETLCLDEDPARGEALFRQAVRAHGRSFVRLIRVDFRPESELGEFDWKLVSLHDPRRDPVPGPPAARPGRPRGPRPERAGARGTERVRVPVRLYLLFFLLGVLLFTLGYLALERTY